MLQIGKKFSYIKYFVLLIISIIIWKIIDNPEFLSILRNITKPFIWAFVIAFFLNTALKVLEKNFKLKRWMNILIVYLIFYGIIVLFFAIITPKVIDSIKNIIKDFPFYARKTQMWLSKNPGNLMDYDKYGVFDYIKASVDDLFVKLGSSMSSIVNRTIIQVISITSFFINFILGSIISVYMLKDKEYFAKNLSQLIYAIFPRTRAEGIIDFFKEIQNAFSKFLVGKSLDSLIIGLLCFLGCLIIGVRHAVLISLMVGVTNMIPYFGPFIGMIPSVLITVFYSPFKAFWVLVFIFLLQQFDGLYLGPKILGIQVGIKPFWIILSVIIGGRFFGIWGMLFAVPMAAVIKTILGKFIIKRQKNGIID